MGDTGRQVEFDGSIALGAEFGTEYRVSDNISLRGEYLHFGFNEESGLCINCAPDPTYADRELHLFRSDISYHFN